MKYCPTCQRTFDDEKVFCGSDGTRLVSDAPTAHAEQPSAPPSAWPSTADAPSSWPSTTPAPPSAWPSTTPEPTNAWPSTPQPAPHAEPTRAAEPQRPAAQAQHAGPLERIRCDWCQAMNEGTALSCR